MLKRLRKDKAFWKVTQEDSINHLVFLPSMLFVIPQNPGELWKNNEKSFASKNLCAIISRRGNIELLTEF